MGRQRKQSAKQRQSVETKRSAKASLPVPAANGYGRPPIEWQFQKGISGNPKGRPRGAKSLKTLLREALRSKVVVPDGDGLRTISVAEALIEKQVELGLSGSGRATLTLLRLAAAFGALEEQEAEETPLTPAEQKIVQDLLTQGLKRAGGAGKAGGDADE